MTSNIGSNLILEEKDPKRLETGISTLLREHFRPEFLNRVDEVVTFEHLGREQLAKIIGLYTQKLNEMLKPRNLHLEFTPNALTLLAEKGYDRDFGARPMKRVFQREIQNPLAVGLLEGRFTAGATVKIDSSKDEFVFKVS